MQRNRVFSIETFPESKAFSEGTAALVPVNVGVFPIAAGAAGARDVQLFNANCPHAMEILAVAAVVDTPAGAGATGQLRNAAAGAGDVRSGPVAIDAAGRAHEDAGGGLTGSASLARGDSLYFRMTDGTAALRLHVLYRRV